MQQVKNENADHLKNKFILFENKGQLKTGLILVCAGPGLFGPSTLVDIAIGIHTEDRVIIEQAEIQNAYIMTPLELVEFTNKNAEMVTGALDALNKIYGFLETLKKVQ